MKYNLDYRRYKFSFTATREFPEPKLKEIRSAINGASTLLRRSGLFKGFSVISSKHDGLYELLIKWCAKRDNDEGPLLPLAFQEAAAKTNSREEINDYLVSKLESHQEYIWILDEIAAFLDTLKEVIEGRIHQIELERTTPGK